VCVWIKVITVYVEKRKLPCVRIHVITVCVERGNYFVCVCVCVCG